MKYEIGTKRPDYLQEDWQGQYEIFSHFEFVSGIPSSLFLITTLKENGKVNACFHSWSSFSGDSGGFFAIMPGLMQHTHTYQNILREKEFCVNFVSAEYYGSCLRTIQNNGEDIDELAIAGFTAESAKTLKVPRIQEAFLTFECKLEQVTDLSGKGITAMIIGKVQHAAVEETHKNAEAICKDFMYFINEPKDPGTGKAGSSAVAALHTVKEE